MSEPTVRLWPERYEAEGVDGLFGKPHPGKGPVHGGKVHARILALSRQSPPRELGVTHWSSRLLAGYLRREGVTVSHVFVADVWRDNGLRPWQQGTFRLSTDPRFEEKVTDIVGLYLAPPEGAVVLCVDEKSQVQALDRTQPLLPMTFDKQEKRTHDYVRHGTTTLFAALNVGTGEVTAACRAQHRAVEFLDFLETVEEKYRGRETHVVLDNFSTHSTAAVKEWLTDHPEFHFHFTPVSGTFMNQVETWFGVITKQAIRRGTFKSVAHLIGRINDYVANWNGDCKPFTWTADAASILAKVKFIESQVRAITGHSCLHWVRRRAVRLEGIRESGQDFDGADGQTHFSAAPCPHATAQPIPARVTSRCSPARGPCGRLLAGAVDSGESRLREATSVSTAATAFLSSDHSRCSGE